MKRMLLKSWYILAALLVVLQACTKKIINLSQSKADVKQYYEGGQYENELKKAIDEAIGEFEEITIPENALVIFDIDETTLSNYKYIKSLDFGYEFEDWQRYLKEDDADVIPETKRLYDWLINKGVKVIFLTGRHIETYEHTKENLEKVGYTKFEKLIVRDHETKKIPAIEFKTEERRKLTKAGYKIIGCVGDQLSDTMGLYTGIKVKLPNCMYFIE